MSQQPKTPLSLLKTQSWFAEVITQPLQLDQSIQPLSPSQQPIETEALEFLSSSSTMAAHERIEIYNQQYWWRLQKVLRKTFPLVVSLFGIDGFLEKIAVPYLLKFPPNHWSLDRLGDRLNQWAAQEYREEDRELVADCISLDWAFYDCFSAKKFPSLSYSQGDQEALLREKLFLQPYVRIFQFPYDLLEFRYAIVQESSEYWIENDFPPLPQEEEAYFFVVYRNQQNELWWERVSQSAFEILQKFQQGMSVQSLCRSLSTCRKAGDATAALPIWLRNWTAEGWLTTHSFTSG